MPDSKTKFAPDSGGHYGPYGGRYAPEVLIPALEELEATFTEAKSDATFLQKLGDAYKNFIGRPSALYFCENLTKQLGGAKIFIKNEGLNLTGAHKINHCVGQILLAERMGKRRIVAETGAGQHGVATASVCARFGMECVVYMGAHDMARQRPNVFWMERLGAKVIPVEFGGKRLKDAVNAAIKDWITNVQTTHYLLGSCLGPHPFPEINRFFQAVVGREIRAQITEQTGRLPDYIIACVGGGSNALGAFDDFLTEEKVQLIGVEAGGVGNNFGEHASRFNGGRPGIVEGYKTIWLQDEDGQVANTTSISAGLDYAGIGPLHAFLHDLGRVQYTSALDSEAVSAFELLGKNEGILASLESSHALAEAFRLAPTLSPDKSIVVNLSGRGDKDLFILAKYIHDPNFKEFLQNFIVGEV